MSIKKVIGITPYYFIYNMDGDNKIMAQIKNLTRAMILALSKKCKIKPDEYGYRRNTKEIIELVNKNTGESKIINKTEYRLSF